MQVSYGPGKPLTWPAFSFAMEPDFRVMSASMQTSASPVRSGGGRLFGVIQSLFAGRLGKCSRHSEAAFGRLIRIQPSLTPSYGFKLRVWYGTPLRLPNYLVVEDGFAMKP